mgnify:CR=1 FL=1
MLTFRNREGLDDPEQAGNLLSNYFENEIDTNSVRWINDCEFIVKKINPTSRNDAKAIHMKILTTSKNSYTFEYAAVGDKKNKQKGVAKKVK